MVGSSNGILCELFYAVLFIIVYTGLFKFHCKSVLFSSFSLGPKVKAIKLRFDFSLGLVC